MLLQMVVIAREPRLILLTLTSMVLVCGQLALMGFLTLTLVHRAGYSLGLALSIFTLSQVAAIFGRLAWGWISDHIFPGSRTLPLATNCILVALAVAVGIASIDAGTPPWIAVAARARPRLYGRGLDRRERHRLCWKLAVRNTPAARSASA